MRMSMTAAPPVMRAGQTQLPYSLAETTLCSDTLHLHCVTTLCSTLRFFAVLRLYRQRRACIWTVDYSARYPYAFLTICVKRSLYGVKLAEKIVFNCPPREQFYGHYKLGLLRRYKQLLPYVEHSLRSIMSGSSNGHALSINTCLLTT